MAGRKQQRCIDMLEALGIKVKHVTPASGHWKKKQADVYAWEWSGYFNGLPVGGGCWETMTVCAMGDRLEWDRKNGEVSPVICWRRL